MSDVVVIGLVVGMCLLTWGLIELCGRLEGRGR